jgi:hypothetical protein
MKVLDYTDEEINKLLSKKGEKKGGFLGFLNKK